MSSSGALTADPKQVVFIDSRAPDIQALIAGVQPGELVFVLDPASDGVQQIADILAANNLTNLDSISIVGHGASGEIDLGATVLNDADLAAHAAALSTIGAALAPGGDLALYACNTAAGATGQQFIADLSQYAGGVDVAAATHLVGDAAHGGSWTLDASTGAIQASTPFTAATLASFQGELAGGITSQIWFGASGDSATDPLNPFGYVDFDGSVGSNRTPVGTTPAGTGQTSFVDIALDTAAGLYFAVSIGGSTNQYAHLVVGHMSGGTPIDTALSLNPTDYSIHSITIDPEHHVLYIGIWGDGTADSGIIKLSYDPGTGTVNGGNDNIFSGSVIASSYFIPTTGASFTNPQDLYLDVGAQKIYFAANDLDLNGSGPYGAPFTDTNGIYVTDLATHVTSLLTNQAQFPITAAGSAHAIVALTINTQAHLIYFATQDLSTSGTTHSTIWQMPIGGGTATQMTLPTSLGNVSAGGLAYDADSNQIIVSDSGATPAIYAFSLNTAGTTFTGDIVLAHGDESVLSAKTGALALDELAHIGTLSGTTTEALEGGAGTALLSSATGLTDSDSGGYLASATVTISNNAQPGDILGIDSTFSHTGFVVSYDSGTHTLTITNASGVENTFAQYDALLAHVTFTDTGTDSSTGAHPTRGITWQVNDGAVGNPVGPNNTTTTTITIDRAPTTVADTNAVLAGASTTTASVLTNDTDKDGDSLTVTAVNGSGANVGNSIAGTYGHLTLGSDGSYTYSADNTSAISSAATGSHPTDTFTYTESDGHGGTSTSTLTITLDRAPTVTADTGAAVESGAAGTGNVLTNDVDPDGDSLTVTAVNGSGANVGNSLAGTYGHLTLGSNGSYSYSADNTSAIDAAATGSHLTDTFTYTANDGHGGTTSSTLTMTIDRPPTAVADTASAVVNVDTTGNVLTNDSDRDGDSLTVAGFTDGAAGTIGTLFHGTYGDITLNSDGSYTYKAGATVGEQTAIAGAGANPTEIITYTVSDGNGGTTSSTLTIGVQTAPTVSSINLAGSSPNHAGTESFTVTFSEAVTGVDLTDFTATTTGTVADTGITVTPVSGSIYTVTVNGITGDGTLRLDLNASGTGIQDGSGTAIAGGFTGGQVYTIDHTAPTASSIVATGSSPNNASSDSYTVTFSEAVTGVDASDFTVTTTGSVADTGVTVATTDNITYTVTVNGVAGDGTLRLDLNNSGTGITDAAGNAVSGGFTSGDVYTIQHTPPVVSSISKTGSSPNNASSDQYTVTFSEAVTGVDASDFAATTTGGVTDSGITVTPVSGSVYTVTVNGVAGDGTLRLDLNNSGTGITDAAGNAITSGFTSGQIYTIDHTAPTTTSESFNSAGGTQVGAGGVVTFTVNMSEAVKVTNSGGGLPTLQLNDGEVATYSGPLGSSTSALTFSYTVQPTDTSADLQATAFNSLAAGTTIQDAAGNNADLSHFTAIDTGVTIIPTTNQPLFGAITHDVTSPGGDIYALYETILGRAPDPIGFEGAVAALNNGTSLTTIAQSFLSSPEYTGDYGPYAQSPDSSFVNQLYLNGLHRPAEPTGLAGWDGALAHGMSRAQVAVGIALSQESHNDLAPTFQTGVFVPSASDAALARLYYGLLGRAPDAAGLANWEGNFAQGMPLMTIATDFISSPEFAAHLGAPTNAQFVNALYEGALGRPADPVGGQGWVNQLNLGASRASVALGIAESPEAMTHLASQIETGFKIA